MAVVGEQLSAYVGEGDAINGWGGQRRGGGIWLREGGAFDVEGIRIRAKPQGGSVELWTRLAEKKSDRLRDRVVELVPHLRAEGFVGAPPPAAQPLTPQTTPRACRSSPPRSERECPFV
jgi:hypothetical protein